MPGAYVVLVDWRPLIYLERGGRGLVRLMSEAEGEQDEAERRMARALAALAAAVRQGLVGRLAIERVDGEPVLGSALEQVLVEIGFSVGPRRLTLRASV